MKETKNIDVTDIASYEDAIDFLGPENNVCMCGNINRFGKVEDLKLVDTNGKGKWAVFSDGKQLTNVLFQ